MTQPVQARSMRITRLDPGGDPVPGSTLTLAGTVSWTPEFLAPEVERYVERQWLPRTATLTVTVRPSRRMLRLLMGPRWRYDRRRHRTVTRRKYRARQRSQR